MFVFIVYVSLPECAAPTVYSETASGCQNSCRLPTAESSCDQPTAPSCVCPNTHILNDDNTCILKSQCPCYDEVRAARPVSSDFG